MIELKVDLEAFVADTGARYDEKGEHIFTQPGEVRVSPPHGNGWGAVDGHGHPIASGMHTREEAEFIARCLNARRDITPVPGTEEGAEIVRQWRAQAEVREAERKLEEAKARLSPFSQENAGLDVEE